MNNLSWFLYLAEIIPALGNAFSVVAGITIFLSGILIFPGLMIASMENVKNYMGFCKKAWMVLIPVSAIFFFAHVLIPSKQTIYLIAGSEAGETVIKTPEAQEIFDDIHKVIKHQLKELQTEED